MDSHVLRATFRNLVSAEAAGRELAGLGEGVRPVVDAGVAAGEERVMWWIVLMIVFWSCVGAVAGATLGAAISLTAGPSGTEALILQVVVWGIFFHLLAGMWAGYLLLADRTNPEVVVKSDRFVALLVSCDSIEQRSKTEEILRCAGALDISLEYVINPEPGGNRDAEHVQNR